MAATGYTPIYLYYSSTASNQPSASNLGYGELAINITDGYLFYKDNANAIQKIGYKLVPVTAGGTGLTSLTSGYIPYGNGTSAFSSSSNLSFDGTNLTVSGITYSNTGAVLGTGAALFSGLLTLRADAGASVNPSINIEGYASTAYNLSFRRAGGTIASPSATPATSILSILGAATGDGTTYANTAAIQSVLEATATTTSMPTALTFAITPSGATARTERLRLRSTGAVAFSGSTNYGSSGQALQSNGDAAPTWGTLGVVGGGTGLATLTANQILYASGTTTVAQSAGLTFDGTNFATTGSVTAGTSLKANVAVGSGAGIDTSGQTGLNLAQSSNGLLISGAAYYLVAISEVAVTGQNAVYILGNGNVSLLGGTGYWVATTTTPADNQFSIAFSGGNYRLYNGKTAAGTYTFKACITKIS